MPAPAGEFPAGARSLGINAAAESGFGCFTALQCDAAVPGAAQLSVRGLDDDQFGMGLVDGVAGGDLNGIISLPAAGAAGLAVQRAGRFKAKTGWGIGRQGHPGGVTAA